MCKTMTSFSGVSDVTDKEDNISVKQMVSVIKQLLLDHRKLTASVVKWRFIDTVYAD